VGTELVEKMLVAAGPQKSRLLGGTFDGMKNGWPRTVIGHAAIRHGTDFPVIDVLVRHGADVNVVDPIIIVKKGTSQNFTHKHPETPIMTAVRAANVDAVKSLLKHGADPNKVVVQENLGIAFFNGVGLFPKRNAMDYVEWSKTEQKRIPDIERKRAEIVAMLKAAGAKTTDELEAAKQAKAE